MKLHIFIATTRGLVAVQKLRDYGDPDYPSVVTKQGKIDELPISNAYQRLVKKGTGLINEDFAGTAFRMDVSGDIDQGSSWQLGAYLAHLALHHDCLGDGQPESGDKVIIATGELNTSERSVLAVTEISTKTALAVDATADWLTKGIQCCFLFPDGNLRDIPENLPFEVQTIASLHELKALLPARAASDSQSNADVSPPASDKPIKARPEGRQAGKLTSVSAIVAAIVVVTGLTVMQKQSVQPSGQALTPQTQPQTAQHEGTRGEAPKNSSATGDSDKALNNPKLSLVKDDPAIVSLRIALQADIALNEPDMEDVPDCNYLKKQNLEQLSENQFASLSFERLCFLTVIADEYVQDIAILSPELAYFRLLTNDNQHFLMPVSRNKYRTRQYAILASAHKLDSKMQRDIRQLMEINKNMSNLESAVIDWAQAGEIEIAIYYHQLDAIGW